ncbi:ligand-binding sensor domain-containing protein [Longitalea arenae]|uniref:ligand-binding sensor domain-containing protein n=1 Tax=Longitalea arenae TaxID=2812558 RepID=UPI001967BC45|nr:two-component regulator propeller domain-containing protein [Longitalea arenae]
MKYVLIYTLFLMSVLHTSCGQNQTEVKKNIIRSKTKDTVTSHEPHLMVRKIYVPHLMVRNIKQDRNGNILIAGSNSSVLGDVFRYDGKSFTNLTSKLASHRFWDVLEDRRGNLWFASLDSGVYYYNGKAFQHFTNREGLANNRVMCIYEDKAGNIWFGTGGGISRYDGKSFRNFTTKEGLSNDDLTTIMEDKTGKFWFGTRGEACFYDGKTFTVLKNKDGKAFKNVWSIIEDKKGSIWFGDVEGLWRYDGRTFTKVSKRGAYAIIEDKKGNIWTTGEVNPGRGVWALSRYDQKSLYNKKPSVTEIISEPPALLGLLEASDGSIWFGGMGSFMGVYRYDGKTNTDF